MKMQRKINKLYYIKPSKQVSVVLQILKKEINDNFYQKIKISLGFVQNQQQSKLIKYTILMSCISIQLQHLIFKIHTQIILSFDKDANLYWNDDQQQAYLQDITEIKISNYLYGPIWQIVRFKDFHKMILTLDQFTILKFVQEQFSPLLLIYIENSALLFEFLQNKTQDNQNQNQKQIHYFNMITSQVFIYTFVLTFILKQKLQNFQKPLKTYNKTVQSNKFIISIQITICFLIRKYFTHQTQLQSPELLKKFTLSKISLNFKNQVIHIIQFLNQSYIYCLEGTKIIYLKKLITYEYQIHYPIQYQTYQIQFLAHLAFKINQENNLDYFVFIYDFDKPISSQSYLLMILILYSVLFKVYIPIKQTNLNFDTYIKAYPHYNQKLNLKFPTNKYVQIQPMYLQIMIKPQERDKKIQKIIFFSENLKSQIINISKIPLQSTEIVAILQCKQYIVDICLKDKKSLIISSFSDPYYLNIENLTISHLIKHEKFINGSYFFYLDDNNLYKNQYQISKWQLFPNNFLITNSLNYLMMSKQLVR